MSTIALYTFVIAVATFSLLVHSRPGLLLAKRDNTIKCSTPGKGTGTHCAVFSDVQGYAYAPTGVDSDYQCQDFNAQGRGIGQCSFHDGQAVVLACENADGSQLQVTFTLEKSSVSNVQGSGIKWYWDSEEIAGIIGGANDTVYSDDNINIDCTPFQSTHT